MKSRRCRIIAIVAAVLVVAVLLHVGRVFGVYPKMAPWEKEKILNVLNEYTSDYYELFWYENSDDIDEPGATRYIGTYGDCYAFLVIGSKTGASGQPYEGPVQIDGLTREVYYPVHVHVVLYRTDSNSQYRPVWYLYDETREHTAFYISDWQLERLTRDIEKLAEQYG